ncbi:hypothetical protein ACFYMO_26115 [Streptomyces sp. NPDC007025]|uniref:hypothetical protein n=1 Tax=Streptomyces sp. NPDC007025 TaxID=3364771 RepID=UPI00367A652B
MSGSPKYSTVSVASAYARREAQRRAQREAERRNRQEQRARERAELAARRARERAARRERAQADVERGSGRRPIGGPRSGRRTPPGYARSRPLLTTAASTR